LAFIINKTFMKTVNVVLAIFLAYTAIDLSGIL